MDFSKTTSGTHLDSPPGGTALCKSMEKSVHHSSLTSAKCVKSLYPLPLRQTCQTQKRKRAKSKIELVILDRYKSHITSKFICTFLNAQKSSDIIYPLKLMLNNSSSSCSGRIRFDSCSLYPQNEIGPSISSSVVLCVFVLLVYIVVLV